MLTEIEIENFRGFGKAQTLTMGPLTLMFGRNSGGKTTVLHALRYLQQIFSASDASLGPLAATGGQYSLGGYQQCVYCHDVNRTMKFRLQFSVPPNFFRYQEQPPDKPFEPKWSLVDVIVHVSRLQPDGGEVVYFAMKGDGVPIFYHKRLDESTESKNRAEVGLNQSWLESMDISVAEELGGDNWTWPVIEEVEDLIDYKMQFEQTDRGFYGCQANFVHQDLATRVANYVRQELNSLIGIGPIREIPGANYEPVSSPPKSRWYSGFAAWDVLHWMPKNRIDQVNSWLGNDRLKTGVRVASQRLLAVEDQAADNTLRSAVAYTTGIPRLRLVPYSQSVTRAPSLRPQDVGIGISQLLPVVVASLGEEGKYVLVEQPELHLHPSVQTALGDLFLTATKRSEASAQRQLIIETHSEHLILRILRRIRETHENELPPHGVSAKPDDVAVLYFEDTADGTRVTHLQIDEEGEFVDRWPYGFFDERAEELF